jgi:hypothetical protein
MRPFQATSEKCKSLYVMRSQLPSIFRKLPLTALSLYCFALSVERSIQFSDASESQYSNLMRVRCLTSVGTLSRWHKL